MGRRFAQHCAEAVSVVLALISRFPSDHTVSASCDKPDSAHEDKDEEENEGIVNEEMTVAAELQ